jgi:NAD(P)-dependent dehydrogenase (short-subunit alcohol dehydrogenase family)
MENDEFRGKVVLVTGGASGIGLACARRFAAAGAIVVIAELLVEQQFTQTHGGFSYAYRQADVSQTVEIEALIDWVIAGMGGIDVCVCAAGIGGPLVSFDALEEGAFDRILAVNLKGPFMIGQRVGEHMRETGRSGSIIHISSVGARLAVESQSAYCISKAGLDMLTKVMAISLAPHGIRVNAVGPGPVETAMTAGLLAQPEAVRQVLSRTPLGRFGNADEIAGVVYFLAGPDAGYITGQTIYADGGRLALNYMMPPRPTASP